MEFQTMAAAGRLSEILGPVTLDFDRTARRKGMIYAAENAVHQTMQDSLMREVFEAYSDGINSYIKSLPSQDLPLEYKLLNYQPELWTPLKTGLLLKYMANTLNFSERDLENTNALKLFGHDILDLVYPDLENPVDPVVDNPNGWKHPSNQPALAINEAPNELVRRKLVPEANPYNGSNNWAVGPGKTASGHAILCNDPHLGLSLPSIWYVMQLHAPGVNVLGACLLGSPNVIIGFNDSIAWGVTNAQRDLVDWYKIKFRDNTKSEYLLDSQWVQSEPRIEAIGIRGQDPLIDTVYYTHFGPVLFDDHFHPSSEKKYYALRWIAHDPSEEARTFYMLNRARNYDDYMQALNYYSSPAQNFAFASTSGDIAMRVQGKYPLKKYEEGKYLLDGTTTIHDWTFIPNDENVMYKNPNREFVASANQYPADSTYPYYITASSYENYRNRRINSVLRKMNGITPQAMMALQNDNFNLKAAESLHTFLHALDSLPLNANEEAAFQSLARWDYYNNVDSEAASYYERWWDILYPMIWDEIKDSEVQLAWPTSFTTIKLIKENPDFSFFDDQSTPEKETAKEILVRSFKKMAAEMAEWKENHQGDVSWATYKGTYIRHLLRIKPFGRYNISIGGNHQIVNATSANHGPSWRMIVDLDPKGVKAYGVYPGGQSGNPGSPYYDNMIELWAKGEYLSLSFMHSADDMPNSGFKNVFVPITK